MRKVKSYEKEILGEQGNYRLTHSEKTNRRNDKEKIRRKKVD
jgi:hypothetical protein